MNPVIRFLPAVLVILLLVACGRNEAPAAASQDAAKAGDHAAAAEIAWFPGTVEEAFAAAKEQGL